MRYSLTMTEALFAELADVVFAKRGLEGAAYVLCGTSVTDQEVRLLAREVIPVADAHYLSREADRLSIGSDSYVAVAKRARLEKHAIVFVHSHPADHSEFSPQDDQEDTKLLKFFESRAPGFVHGEMVLSSPLVCRGRVWVDGGWQNIARIRTIGRRFRFRDYVADGDEPVPEFFDRQVRAFGPDVQRLLKRIHIGVVGAGGTGSAVIEQLIRLGVGTISVFDGDRLDKSNVTRVYASKVADEGGLKVDIQSFHGSQIGLGTDVRAFPGYITDQKVAKHLRDCDVIFGCTDKQAPRGILMQLSVRYLIPCIDVAAKVHSEKQVIRGIWGRVTTVMPGEACLFCRGTIDPEKIRAESLPPEQRDMEVAAGYITEIATNEPAVVMFTTAVASQAVSELLHRLTGFMGEHRLSSEVLLFFHESRTRTNRQNPRADCLCQQRDYWGRGDTRDFLGLFWS